jgi:hypothetical protein
MKTYTFYVVSHDYGVDVLNRPQVVQYVKDWWHDFEHTRDVDNSEMSDDDMIDLYFYDNWKEWISEVTITDKDLIPNQEV